MTKPRHKTTEPMGSYEFDDDADGSASDELYEKSDVIVRAYVSKSTHRKLVAHAAQINRTTSSVVRGIIAQALVNVNKPEYKSLPHLSLSYDALRRSLLPFTVTAFGKHQFRYAVSIRKGEMNRVVLTEREFGHWVRCSDRLAREVRAYVDEGQAAYVE